MKKILAVMLGVVFAVSVFAVSKVEAKMSVEQLKTWVENFEGQFDSKEKLIKTRMTEGKNGLKVVIWSYMYDANRLLKSVNYIDAGHPLYIEFKSKYGVGGMAVVQGGGNKREHYPFLTARNNDDFRGDVAMAVRVILIKVNNLGVKLDGYPVITSSEVELTKVAKYFKSGEWVRAQAQLDELKRLYPWWERDYHFRIVGDGIMQAVIYSNTEQAGKANAIYQREFMKDVLNNFKIIGYRMGEIYWDMQMLVRLYDKSNIALYDNSWDMLRSGRKYPDNRKITSKAFDEWKKLDKYIIILEKGGKSSKFLTHK